MIVRVVDGCSYLISHAAPPPDPSRLVKPTPERVAELVAMPYRRYLQTPEWREKRRVEIAAAEHRCRRCGAHGPLELHHLTYRNLGNEPPEDLVVLCVTCHQEAHRNAA